MYGYNNRDFYEIIVEIESDLEELNNTTQFHDLTKSTNINYYNQLVTMSLIIKGMLQDREKKTV